MPQPDWISPLAIDLGAANTGVYSTHYPAGATLGQIDKAGTKAGTVYQLEKDKYTLLMQDRTGKRHQRRGFDRRQMVKRLFKLIWERHFRLGWDKDVQQTISFLLNRRGFSFLDGEYDADILREFPQAAFDKLPKSVKEKLPDFKNEDDNEDDSYDLASALTAWSKQNDQIAAMFNEVNKEPSSISRRQVIIKRTTRLREYCGTRAQGQTVSESDKAPVKLARLPKWIVDEWIKQGAKGLDEVTAENNNINMVDYLNKQSPE